MDAAPTPAPRALTWNAEALWQQLRPLLPGITVEVVARCESTNSVLLERARASSGWPDQPVTGPGALDDWDRQPPAPLGRRAGDVQPCLLVAEHQTHGRGRLGRPWQSTPGASLTFSLSLPLAPADWSGLSLAVGVALADALEPAVAGTAPRIGLKWPNDLWLLEAPGRGRKLGGVLIETVAVGRLRMVVIGVGLNVAPQSLGELSSGYACLQEFDAQATAPSVLHRVATPLARALTRFERDGFAASADGFARRDLLCGQPVVTSAPQSLEGVAEGVSPRGELRVRDAADRVHEVGFGDVSVRLRPPAGE